MRVSYAIVFVSDMQRSVAFYRDTLGLSLKFESTMWTEFSTGDATLALHVSDLPEGVRSGGTDLPPGGCKPGFAVPDLDAFHRRMVGAGVTCLQQPEELFGARVAQYLDPDGLPISIGEDSQGG